MNRKLLGIAAAAVFGAAALAIPPAARADLIWNYSLDGGTTWLLVCTTTGFSCGTGATGMTLQAGGAVIGDVGSAGFFVEGTVASNSPGSPTLGFELNSTTWVQNEFSTTQAIKFDISSTDFASPTTPPPVLFESAIGGSTTIPGASNTLSFSSCVDTSNTQNPTDCTGGFSSGSVSPSITGSPLFWSDGSQSLIGSLSSPYSLNEFLDISMNAGSMFNYAGTARLTPIPEPASLAILGGALLGFGLIRRRRRNS